MTTKVFIDGKAGTTGLRIYDRLQSRSDITLLTLSEEDRKDPAKRKEMLNSCDIAFLCLPDDASREAVSMIENDSVVVLDTSTAHRTLSNWTYGFPELSPEYFNKVAASKRIAVPGCHASGFIALVKPLIEKGLISENTLLTCHSITGYSGGGKKMIAEYEGDERDVLLGAPRQYGISQTPISNYITAYSLDGNRKYTAKVVLAIIDDYDMMEDVKALAKKLNQLAA